MPGWVNVDATALPGVDVVADLDVLRKVRKLRNIAREMLAEVEAVKPIRAPDRALLRAPAIEIAYSSRQGQPSAVTLAG